MVFRDWWRQAVVEKRGKLDSSVLSVLAKESRIQNNQRKQEEHELWEENSRATGQARTWKLGRLQGGWHLVGIWSWVGQNPNTEIQSENEWYLYGVLNTITMMVTTQRKDKRVEWKLQRFKFVIRVYCWATLRILSKPWILSQKTTQAHINHFVDTVPGSLWISWSLSKDPIRIVQVRYEPLS